VTFVSLMKVFMRGLVLLWLIFIFWNGEILSLNVVHPAGGNKRMEWEKRVVSVVWIRDLAVWCHRCV